jgi:Uma2 family endonuclease
MMKVMSGTLAKETPKYVGWKVTREEYLSLPDDGFVYDMIDGVLELSPSAFFDHGNLSSNFVFELKIFLEKIPLGKVTIETDIFLPDGGDVLRPDISFILNENLHIIKGHIHGTPDLICEVLSESTKVRDLGVKANRYLLNGVKEYWILDPMAKTAEVWYNLQKLNWEIHKENLLKSKLLPGFMIQTETIF